MALMEERKRKLAAEGLFDEARKQLLPWLPEVIGVVTSPTGAVIRDILHRLQDRFPRRVLVWPVKVQGEGSAEQVAAAIRGFNALPEGGKIPRPDLLIVARGGGSLEDLWSFNEEIVVRAAAESMIPLISAVGHETDITLIDFAADKRAPTPTAAAEMAVPVRSELLVEVAGLARRTMVCWLRGQESRRNELRAAARALPAASELLAIPRQRLDSARRILPRGLKANTNAHHRRFSQLSAGLTLKVLRGQVAQARQRLTVSGERIRLSARALLRHRRDRFAGLEVRLKASKLSNAQAQRNAIARDRERTQRLAERARRALVTAMTAAATPASPIAASCCRRCPIAACWRAALRWCATNTATPCMPRPRSGRARICRSNSPTAAWRRRRMRIGRRRRRRRRASRHWRGEKPRRSRPSAWSSRSIRAVCFSRQSLAVMPGLVPGIHDLSGIERQGVDGRRHHGERQATPSSRRLCPAMTSQTMPVAHHRASHSATRFCESDARVGVGADVAALRQAGVGVAADRVQRKIGAVEIMRRAGIDFDPRQRAAAAGALHHLAAGGRRTDVVLGADQQQRRHPRAPAEAGGNPAVRIERDRRAEIRPVIAPRLAAAPPTTGRWRRWPIPSG